MKKMVYTFGIAILSMAFIFISCSKESSEPSLNTVFKPTDFQIYDIDEIATNPLPNEVICNYKIKNKTAKDYRANIENGFFEVTFSMKGSDGAWYDDSNVMGEFNAGASYERSFSIVAPTGITLDRSSLKYIIQHDPDYQ